MIRRALFLLDAVRWFVVEGLKEALDARMRRRAIGTCTRMHQCLEEGPCNGWPRCE